MENIKQILSSQMVNITSIALAVISIILAYIFYRRSQRLKEPMWAIRNINLVEGFSSKVTGLEVLYKNQKVENLSVAKLAFWNNGAETIQRQDIASANPLRISSINQISILDVKPLVTNNESSQFTVTLTDDKSSALINFDYLDQGQGSVLQIVHTGISSDVLMVTGDIKGAKLIRRRSIRIIKYIPLPTSAKFDEKLKPRTKRFIAGLYYMFVGAAGISAAIYISMLQPPSKVDWVFAPLVILGSLTICWRGVSILKSYAPQGLETFEDETMR